MYSGSKCATRVCLGFGILSGCEKPRFSRYVRCICTTRLLSGFITRVPKIPSENADIHRGLLEIFGNSKQSWENLINWLAGALRGALRVATRRRNILQTDISHTPLFLSEYSQPSEYCMWRTQICRNFNFRDKLSKYKRNLLQYIRSIWSRRRMGCFASEFLLDATHLN